MRIDGLDEFIQALDEAIDGGLQSQYELWLEAMGYEFLDIMQDEIMKTETVETRRLLNSFEKGDEDNIFSTTAGNLTLDVGTNLEYASFVNDGHFTIDPSKNLDRRWVPGRWKGDRFEYDPAAETGMLLKFQWIDGSGFWDNALAIFERMFEKSLDRKLQEWLDEF
ncbi:HK97 gp10 family phage protein [Bacillus licheniformis]|uniref:HK97 gp10 family phage protein n=1 Tax=Bacillus licheniformis TaxID=1402 RepID=UPI000312B98F|nr:HK97 gp10 family phage protein [Bacillus licheniformis]KAA0815507.1 HK97 gp10 family phage protein [Bacillus licheniformis]KAA0830934.1 HK97 gp10 family phage protein [Bacillus licheniformis]KAA0847488.1 HK97 gp10 family phage protein [Bacillus licheniformis]MED0688685.1 HK97 gp10 family phage protein [Bacillus licheniformis]MED0713101.1 HK97 gp10 family phage protein [Bacillus licheniformis]